ncbi:hypothetical protein [Nocardia abscessus]|uniref:hypothetical protein n=1 Tax=Nocardia abscessus TaxID=120957 RepID=UPI0024568737|nr:hypothetical protein [Nocardia abscessus]
MTDEARDTEVQADQCGTEVKKVSPSSFARLLALRDSELAAVRTLAKGDGYADFFVEGSGPPWHEAFGDAVKANPQRAVPASRMARLDAFRLRSDDGYSDFFVEGSDRWHEAFGEKVTPRDPFDVGARTRALQTLRVMEAYARARRTV